MTGIPTAVTVSTQPAARWKVHHQHDSQLGALDVLGVFVRALGVSVVLDVLQALVCLGFRLQVRLLKEWLVR